SGGGAATRNGGRLSSPGSRTAPCSERSAAVVPPSTASGPRMPESRCGCFGNVVRFWRPGASSKNGSASSGTFRPTYQSPQVGAGQVCGGLLAAGGLKEAAHANWTTESFWSPAVASSSGREGVPAGGPGE